MSEEKIRALEEFTAHQGRTVEELSDEVRRQGDAIVRLERTVRELAERFLALEDVATPRAEATRPPHY